ncbi:CBS domain-containing protein [Thioalkalivibrio sulfidiphilus]|uniref:CBS domain containing protein n=1 Tax=Thioalkalivibrio sulfidiphilus (strain HL-EbGR7) TaxID=396588 RepID=B8GUS9_THISH|nr:CBS domain-containing protein [Thioalkalivibrio sulfidiphilus]ACL71440.1 CBS domain containing protein [Thioalkalivibrio sulfidiphilus HL-EbGr7]
MTAETSRKPLPSFKAPAQLGYVEPGIQERVVATSPAMQVMTSLRNVSASTIRPGASLVEANQTMIARGVRLLLVVDPEGQVIGLITARDTQGERPIQMVHERGGRFEDLQVRDLMIPRESIDLIDMRDVMRAEVRDIVATLKDQGRQHALVASTDQATGRTRICGIFSATQIGRQLGLSVQTFEVAKTFAEIQAALAKEY